MAKTEVDALTTLEDGLMGIVEVTSQSPETLIFNPAWWVRGVVGVEGSVTIKVAMGDDDLKLAVGTISAGSALSLPNLNQITVETSDPFASCFIYALKPFRPYLTDYYRIRLRLVTKTVQSLFATPTEIVIKVAPQFLNAFQQGVLTSLPTLTEISSLQLFFYLLNATAKTLRFVSDASPYLNSQTDDVVLPDTLTEIFNDYTIMGWTGEEFKVEFLNLNETDLEGLCQAIRDATAKLRFATFVSQTLTAQP